MFVLDSHCDTPSQILRLRDLRLDNARGHVDFPKLRKGGVDASFFALYIPKELSPDEGFAYARKLMDATVGQVQSCPDIVRMTSTAAQALENKENGLISIFLGLENASPISSHPERFDWFADRGVRYITLCHNADNALCDSAAQATTHHGLSDEGKKLVGAMNERGVLVDCAHISDEAFWDVIRCSRAPVVSTHSCCRALSPHRRNMTDEMICALADKGGVIQINFYPVFLEASFADVMASSPASGMDWVEDAFIADPSNDAKRAAWYKVEDMLSALPRPSYKRIVDHIDHVVKLVGPDFVGIGSDFDGIGVTPEGMENVTCLPLIFDEMRRRGYTEENIEKIAGGNFLRLL